MRTPRVNSLWTLEPVGIDSYDKRSIQRLKPFKGNTVRVIQPYGTPKNGTMGHVYVMDVDSGKFIGLVLIDSLQKRS